MGKQQCQIVAPVALLLLGILGILLLAIPTDDMKEPPDYMVKSVLLTFFLSYVGKGKRKHTLTVMGSAITL